MDDNATRLRGIQRNIDRYQNLLKSNLSTTELRFVERRLSEERFTMAMLEFINGSSSARDVVLPGRPRAEP
jgi:hypothetical protein